MAEPPHDSHSVHSRKATPRGESERKCLYLWLEHDMYMVLNRDRFQRNSTLTALPCKVDARYAIVNHNSWFRAPGLEKAAFTTPKKNRLSTHTVLTLLFWVMVRSLDQIRLSRDMSEVPEVKVYQDIYNDVAWLELKAEELFLLTCFA